jgi:2-polyprenyl-3-methyl-5-hydroxy-6-metoxy-1,4-benzoquinol methylase
MENFHKYCLNCHSENLVSLDEEYAHAYLVKCKSCGLIFTKRIPSQEELITHYAKYTRNNSISPITISRYEELLKKFESKRKLNRILDVGCGDGYFLDVAKKKGWEVYGTEFTDNAIELCRSKGINMHQGSVQTFQEEIQFDVITSFEVLEHINDGKSHVNKIFQLLRPDGIFYFTTPNFNSLNRKLIGGKWNVIEYPEHLTYYTSATIKNLLVSEGFYKTSLQTTGYSRQRLNVSLGKEVNTANSDEAFRKSIEEKSYLRFAKKVVNGLLNFSKSGDTLKGIFTKS